MIIDWTTGTYAPPHSYYGLGFMQSWLDVEAESPPYGWLECTFDAHRFQVRFADERAQRKLPGGLLHVRMKDENR